MTATRLFIGLALAAAVVIGPVLLVRPFDPVRVEVVQKGLDHPWDIAFADDGRMLVTERIGRVLVLAGAERGAELLSATTIPDVRAVVESGLIGIAVHGNRRRKQWRAARGRRQRRARGPGCVRRPARGAWLRSRADNDRGHETERIARTRPDAVVLDLEVGLQADYGIMMAQELRRDERYASIPIVVAPHAEALDGATATLRQIGVPILLKPFTFDEFHASLEPDPSRE